MTALMLGAARELFPGAAESVYLNTAAEGLIAGRHGEALARYASDRVLGENGRAAHSQVEARCRELAARLLGVSSDEIAFLASTARALDAVLQSVAWESGDNLVVSDLEFPTTIYAALKLAERGVEVRVARADHGALPPEAIERLVDDRTRVLVVGAVSWSSGYRHDLKRLGEIVHRHGGWLLVDAAQALGAVPIDCREVDFLAASAYKWLLGTHGVAVLYVNRRLHGVAAPAYVGWRGVDDIFRPDRLTRYALHADARRYEEGMPNYPGLYALECGLELLLEIGADSVAGHNEALATMVVEGLGEMGLDLLTPLDPELRAGIVAIATPDCTTIAAALARRRIFVWGKDGRLRASVHLYNTEADVDAYLSALDSELRGKPRAA